jgi:hypothetical protein
MRGSCRAGCRLGVIIGITRPIYPLVILYFIILLKSLYVFTMCPTSWIKHLRCGHSSLAVVISLHGSDPCPVDCPESSFIRGESPDFCTYCQEKKCMDCHEVSTLSLLFTHRRHSRVSENITEVCNETPCEHCQCGNSHRGDANSSALTLKG